MQPDRFELIPAFYLAVPFLFLLILINYLGHRFKVYYIRKFPGTEDIGIGSMEGSLLGLTALLLSFSFGMSASKFETRRQHIISETNNIGTAVLRCDMYPDSIRNLLRSDFKNYLETRLAYYDASDNEELIKQTLEQADSISNIIWRRVALLSHDLNNRVASEQMVPALNATIDIVTTREAGRKATIPRIILIVLCILIFVSAFLSGYGSKNRERNKILVVAFAIVTTLGFYLVVDLDKPRQGFVNLNSAEQLMENLRTLFPDNH
ncbi:MAG TPA: hypothetical protein VFE04_12290 [Puia sp.]|nr:hypothetical protein [Puia sp.]